MPLFLLYATPPHYAIYHYYHFFFFIITMPILITPRSLLRAKCRHYFACAYHIDDYFDIAYRLSATRYALCF